MSAFNQRFTRINGLSERRRLPRLGVIRGGIKKKSAKTGKEYPVETPHFVCPDEVRMIFGDEPTELRIMFPINEIDAIFPQSLKWYGSSKGLKCHGDMKMAFRFSEEKQDWFERACPCELLDQGKCKQTGVLMFMIPEVSVGGIYQIRTSSYNSIVDLNSGIDYVTALLGRFAMVPLVLRRDKIETHHDGKKQYHYTMKIIFDVDIATLNKLREDNQRVLTHPQYQLPAPAEDNPEFDPPDVIDEEDENQGPPPMTPEEVAGIVEGEIVHSASDLDTPDDELENLKAQLQKAKNDDPVSFAAGQQNAKVKVPVPKVTIEQAREWLLEIQAYKDNSN